MTNSTDAAAEAGALMSGSAGCAGTPHGRPGFRQDRGFTRQSGAVVAWLAIAAVITAAAQRRITTHPAEPYLKQLFPNAAAISGHEGTPLHWKIYGEDRKRNPQAQPIALAFWSTDVVPLERGYNGPTHMLIGMDFSGTIVGAVMAYSTDPYAYFSVEPPAFAAQFKGKSIRAPFRVGDDIQAVSRATLTVSSATRAVRDSARTMAKLFLNPAALRPPQRPQPGA